MIPYSMRGDEANTNLRDSLLILDRGEPGQQTGSISSSVIRTLFRKVGLRCCEVKSYRFMSLNCNNNPDAATKMAIYELQLNHFY